MLLLRVCLVFYGSFVVVSGDLLGCRNKEEFCKKFSNGCLQCMASDPCCSWINEPNYNGYRCNIEENIGDVQHLTNLRKPEAKILVDEDFSRPAMGVDKPAVQIRPQKISVSLRKGQSYNVTLRYKAAKNYPLDLYYLMDLTYSMGPHIRTLQTLGTALTMKLSKMTENSRLGLGYFADKVLMPYMKMTEAFLKNPCGNTTHQCQPGFDFVHTLNFTENVQEFIEQVKAVKYTANLDDMEGGMDAVSQVIACQRELNWRVHSRKIIVLVTDGYLHFAGDGILGGTVEALPSGCLVHREGNIAIYDGLKYDYPTLSYIHRLLRQNKITLLMVTKRSIFDYYKMMHNVMDDVTKVGELREDSQNVLDLVEEAYTELIQNVRFAAESEDGVASVKFYSTCNKAFGWNHTATCNNIEIEKEYVFNVEIKLLEYKGNKTKVVIEEMNIEEKLEIEIDYVGDCKCVDKEVGVCKNRGVYSCGVCKCPTGWTGPQCELECNRDSGRWKNATYTSTTCMGRGEMDVETCKCVCDEEYMGEFCEWNQCKRDDKGNVCSDHGKCVEEKCKCDEDFAGEICDCTTLQDTCISRVSGKVCHGHGDCECGVCRCHPGNNITYSGKHCDRCPECSNKCEEYEDDVIAFVAERPDAVLDKYHMTKVDNYTNEIYCLKQFLKDDQECWVRFNYEIGVVTEIEYSVTCTKMINYAFLGMGVAVAVIVAPLVALFVWRTTTYLKDKREWALYEKNLKNIKYVEMNPLYKSPITTFRNPLSQTTST